MASPPLKTCKRKLNKSIVEMSLRLHAAYQHEDEHSDLLRCLPTVFSIFVTNTMSNTCCWSVFGKENDFPFTESVHGTLKVRGMEDTRGAAADFWVLPSKGGQAIASWPCLPGFVLLVPALCFTLFTKSALFMATETLAAAEHSSVLTILETEAQKSWKLGGKTEQGSEHLPYFSCICLPLLLMWSYRRKKVKASPEAANQCSLSVVVWLIWWWMGSCQFIAICDKSKVWLGHK